MSVASPSWPEAPVEGWLETCSTLQMWSQMVGKVRLARAPFQNHWWHVPLYLTARGLTTSPMPDGNRTFQIDFDLIDHLLAIATSDGDGEVIRLAPGTIADFYTEFMQRLGKLGIDVSIWAKPVEVTTATAFPDDWTPREYHPEIAEAFVRALSIADLTLKSFCEGFLGKTSPTHFFWGSFDLAMTRFSGRRAPEHPGGVPNLADWVTREAYSHEVWSAGFWPGTAGGFERPAFYAYAYPEPPGFGAARVSAPGHYHAALREFLLPYDAVRATSDPRAGVADFLNATYTAAADLGSWPREALERI
jgi:hypothetical protein